MQELIQELIMARKKNKLTQAILARKLGLKQGNISNIEQGNIDIRTSTLIQIARILGYEVTLVPKELQSLVKYIINNQALPANEPRWQPDL